jgi:hypothetical protein
MKVVEHNVETGEIVERDATEIEIAQREADVELFTQQREAEKRRLAKRAELLERLGLTEDEARVLLG